jgi:hypothetical protein
MPTVQIYDSVTGEIRASLSAPMSELRIPPDDIQYYWGPADSQTEYIDVVSEQPVPRPAWPALPDKTTVTADGVDMVTFSGLPANTHCNMRGAHQESMDITDGTLELTFDFPGTCVVEFYAFPYQNYSVTINAT